MIFISNAPYPSGRQSLLADQAAKHIVFPTPVPRFPVSSPSDAMHLLAETSIRFLLLLSTSLASAAPPASSSAAATSTAPLPPTLQRTCGPNKLSVCCVVSSNSTTTATTETKTSLPSPVRGQNDDDDTEDDGAGEEEGSGRNETTFDVTPLTVHSCRLKEGQYFSICFFQ